MRKVLPIIMLFITFQVFSQQETSKEKVQKGDSSHAIIDSLQIPEKLFHLQDSDDVDFANKISDKAFLKDSVFTLLHNKEAALIDSLWQKELFTSSLYQDYREKLLRQEDYAEEAFKKLPTDTLKKRLAELDAKTPFKIEYNPLLERYIKSYLKRNKKAIEDLMALSAYYFPVFEEKLDKYNIPLEIKYLAIVESSLNPRARSRAGATGLWQFMYATAKMHGLDVSSYVDERMDPVRASEAAAKYLSTLYRIFEDWDLVLASYNSGPGNVSKAIRRSGGSTNYWKLRPYLPNETANYVPAFIAIMYVFEYAEEHGFQPPVPGTTYFETDTVQIKRKLSFEEIEEITGVEEDLLQFLNPSYKLNVIPYVPDEDYVLRLPRKKIGVFVNNEEEIYEYVEAQRRQENEDQTQLASEESRIRYKVKRGDYLGKIAQKFGVKVSNIKKWNGLSGNRLRIGQHLVIYSNGSFLNENIIPELYTVKEGDSLWSISQKFKGLTVQEIKAKNNIKNSLLHPGMKLRLN